MAVEDRWYKGPKKKRVQSADHGRGMRWRVRIPGVPTESFERKEDAVARETQLKAALLSGLLPPRRRDGNMLFDDYVKAYFELKAWTARTRKTEFSLWRSHLSKPFGKMPLARIETSSVNSWTAGMRKKKGQTTKRPLSPNTIVSAYNLLSMILGAAVVDKKIPFNPCDAATTPKGAKPPQRKAWAGELVDKILAGMPATDRTIGLLGSLGGCRQGEAFAVSVESIDRFAGKLHITHQVQRNGSGELVLVPPKSDSKRTIPLDQELLDALVAHMAAYPTLEVVCECCGEPHALLFSYRPKRAMHARPMADTEWNERIWHKALAAAGLTPAGKLTGFHQLRHHLVSVFAEGGASYPEIAAFVGHSSIKTTQQIYSHLFDHSDDKLRGILDRRHATKTGAHVYPLRTAKINDDA